MLEKLQDAGEQPLLMTYKDAWTSNCPWNSIASDLAPESFNDDRKAGKTTFVGTHEEIAEKYMKLLVKEGIDAIITNKPDVARKIVDNT